MEASYDGLQYTTDDQVFIWHINNGKSEPYPRELDIVKRYLRQFPSRNGTFIDVGGHIGTTSLPYSRLFRNVIAFEPNKKSFDFFNINIQSNKIQNITLYNKGVYHKTTKCVCIPHAGGNSGCYYIKEYEEGDIDVISIDDLGISDPIDFIKIDTEGSELHVLLGAINTIKKWSPLIQVETNQCSSTYFGYDKSKIYNFMKELGYVAFDDDGNNPLFYKPSVNDDEKKNNDKNETIYVFWTGDNAMSVNREQCLKNLKEVSKCNVIVVTKDNLNQYILKDHPLHPAYEYLSETHRADYLRTYFMNFHGGGYSDIKKTTSSWLPSFEALRNDDSKWIIGYQEQSPHAIAYTPHANFYKELIGNGAYICKANTKLTNEWYNDMITVLDSKLEKLKQYPSTFPQDKAEISNGKYPIEWNEILGRIFHRVCYTYKERILYTLPIPIFTSYR